MLDHLQALGGDAGVASNGGMPGAFDVPARTRDAEHHGVSLSAWINAAAERALILENGLAAVREWESEHGKLAVEELAWAHGVLGTVSDGQII